MENHLKAVKQNKKIKISCIIPAWNEEKRINHVLEVITDFNLLDEVIVVNDGSTDETAKTVQKYSSSKLKLINHHGNKGKSAAILTGINESSGNLIVLLDADLIGLTTDNITKMVNLVLNKNYDLAILDRAGDRNAIWGWTNCARFFGGERCFWREDFLEVGISETNGYLLEVMMNFHYLILNKKIRNIYCDNLYTVHQYNKYGAFKGYHNYLKMAIKIVREATIIGFIKQIKGIEEDHHYFIEYQKLMSRIITNDYINLRKKLTIHSRIKELQLRFNFEELQDFSYEKYQELREKLALKSQKMINYLSKLIKL